MLLLATALFPYSVSGSGVNIATGDIDMLILVLALLLVPNFPNGQRIRFPSLLIAVMIYFGVCLFSNSFNGIDATTVLCVVQMMLYLVLAIIIIPPYARAIRARWIFAGMVACGVVLASACIINRSAYVLGLHKNALGAALNFAILAAVELYMSVPSRRKLLTACLAISTAGLLFSVSRGAWLGTAVGLVVLFIYRGRFKLMFKVLALLIPVIAITWIAMPKDYKEYATDLSSDSNSNKARFESIAFARSNFERNPLFGVGVGLRKQYDATNVIMSTLAETGIVGLAAFLFIHVVFYWTTWRARPKLSPADPASSFLYLGPPLITAAFVHGCVDHYWNRGLTLPWAAAGLALGAVQIAAGSRAKTARRRIFSTAQQRRGLRTAYTARPSAI